MTTGSPRGSRGRIGVVTCQVLPEPDFDQELLIDALAEAGVDARLLPWDAPKGTDAPSASDFDLCILRSCWNYPQAPEAFLGWCEETAAASRLLNPLPAVRWNLHKRYLAELEEAGVPVVPTEQVPRSGSGAEADLGKILHRRGWDEVVVKPAVSAASFRTRRFAAAIPLGRDAEIGDLAEGQAFLAELAADRDALVQPYLPSVETVGELATVWIDGVSTHAVVKKPRFSGQDEEVSEAIEVSPAARRVVEPAIEYVLERVTPDLLYARIDLMTDEDGQLRISELELMEPSLFLLQEPRALERLVGVLRRLATGDS